MSQGDLGEALGVSRRTINFIENGRYLPSVPIALAIVRVGGDEHHRDLDRDANAITGIVMATVALRCRRSSRGRAGDRRARALLSQ
jgi:putative transcriptional regulator